MNKVALSTVRTKLLMSLKITIAFGYSYLQQIMNFKIHYTFMKFTSLKLGQKTLMF